MPEPTKIPRPFADSGDKNSIPDSSGGLGFASWQEGFPAITGTPFAQGGVAPKRADFNGIFYALSQAVMWMQQGGVYAYDVNTDYEAGNVVLDAGGLYVANAANGPSSVVVQPSSDTTGATWKPVRLDLATQSTAGYMSAEDKAKLDTIIESGSYTPSLEGAAIAGVATYTKRKGYYVKIGKLVYITGEIEGSFTTLPDGRAILTGLPYVVDQITEQASVTVYGYNGGVSNSLSRLVNATVYSNFLRLHVISSRETADRGLGKIDWASWSNTSNDSYYLYITSEASSFRLFWGGCYMTA